MTETKRRTDMFVKARIDHERDVERKMQARLQQEIETKRKREKYIRQREQRAMMM